MDLARALDRCRAFEERAAALYRGLAARAREVPTLCALWTALAREEEQHARSLRSAGGRRAARQPPTDLAGWEEALRDIEARLGEAEALPAGASVDEQLAATLALEMTELEGLRLTLLCLLGLAASGRPQTAHALRLAEAAIRRSEDPHVRLRGTLLAARARLRHPR